jgi:hypothetical protein
MIALSLNPDNLELPVISAKALDEVNWFLTLQISKTWGLTIGDLKALQRTENYESEGAPTQTPQSS